MTRTHIEPKDDSVLVQSLPVFDHEKVQVRSDRITRHSGGIGICTNMATIHCQGMALILMNVGY